MLPSPIAVFSTQAQALVHSLDDDVARLGNRQFGPMEEEFRRNAYARLPELVSSITAKLLDAYALDSVQNNLMMPGDSQVPCTPACYGDPLMETVLDRLRPAVERVTGVRLYPTYSYFRVYKPGDVLPRHTDRAACEISVSLALGIEARDPWPLFIQGREGVRQITLKPSDAVVYRGIECLHWRQAFDGRYCTQLFLHYVDQSGNNARYKFDGRPGLGISYR